MAVGWEVEVVIGPSEGSGLLEDVVTEDRLWVFSVASEILSAHLLGIVEM